MADYALMARDSGAKIIGGCCGTMPDHLRAMRTALETRPAADKPSLDEIVAKVGAFSSDSDGTGDADATPQRTRRSRRRIVA
jgi:5-methyltetrahydrofolate--homocysteine methyltransferase